MSSPITDQSILTSSNCTIYFFQCVTPAGTCVFGGRFGTNLLLVDFVCSVFGIYSVLNSCHTSYVVPHFLGIFRLLCCTLRRVFDVYIAACP